MMPSPHLLQVLPRTLTGRDAHGNDVFTWGPERPWWVRQIDPGGSAEPWEGNRDLSTIAYSIHANADSKPPREKDRVVVDGEEFEVVGRPRNWARGPWENPAAGVVVLLARGEG